jgi:putative ABC transport system permease protein
VCPAEIVAERIERAVTSADGDIEVVTGAALAEEAHAAHMQDWAFFDMFMAGFAAIALVVGGFIIFNTFSITVAQRTREFALLRAIGAGRGQVLGSVLVESSAVAVLASALGLAGGIGVSRALHALFGVFGIDLPTPVSSWLPHRWPSRSPSASGSPCCRRCCRRSGRHVSVRSPRLRDAAIDRAATSRKRIAAGAADWPPVPQPSLQGSGRSARWSWSAWAASPCSPAPPCWDPCSSARSPGCSAGPSHALRGVPGQLARDNTTRCPKRTAATAGALTIGVGLVGLIAILAASVKASIDDMVSTGVRADVVIDSNSVGFGGLDRSLATGCERCPRWTRCPAPPWPPPRSTARSSTWWGSTPPDIGRCSTSAGSTGR